MSEQCNHPQGVAGAHGLPGTRNSADHDTKQRFEVAVCWYMAKYDCDQSTAINVLLDAASRWEKFTRAFPALADMQILPAQTKRDPRIIQDNELFAFTPEYLAKGDREYDL
jgi:hypothetical protein